MPLGHDGYLKLWALSSHAIAADFILLDEAQDTNPVVLDVLRKQPAQMIYVGDKYQQIYEWRGAVNAMEKIETQADPLRRGGVEVPAQHSDNEAAVCLRRKG
ncbi:UvrD-helicase domain-containing protein [Bradyrhizobium sp. SSUT18]|uniref:UvrD-helicase domain-containing protein n=1 Tax=Bradyrhizobium sp. SSUT18 TaxID=3040602 RepID=UPI00244843FB|nr:UvrD-helicase domain-containing protein [Bradyrhizobium sp. SSUT18]MDH2406059.1 UvrD-helicase domain-containing protein [Bradyrhizobium sp. SSUT18]